MGVKHCNTCGRAPCDPYPDRPVRVITAGIAVARGVGGRRGRRRRGGDGPIDVDFGAVGYRERRRRAKLRRRARDREVARILAPALDCGKQLRALARRGESRWIASETIWPEDRWWSTAEGRRRWTEDDRKKKRAMRILVRSARRFGEDCARGFAEGIRPIPFDDSAAKMYREAVRQADHEITMAILCKVEVSDV